VLNFIATSRPCCRRARRRPLGPQLKLDGRKRSRALPSADCGCSAAAQPVSRPAASRSSGASGARILPVRQPADRLLASRSAPRAVPPAAADAVWGRIASRPNTWEPCSMPVINRIAAMQDEIAAWRHDLHAHPELLYDVHRTAASVAEKLKAFGCDEVVTGLGKTGVVGLIRGRKIAQAGRTIALRADMDALPIEEATDVPYKSTVPGKMHACGHDGHTAMLLGASKYLAETRNFAGTAVVIFQPAEEGGAGAKAMLEDGLIERFEIDEVFGMHNFPGLPVGQFAIRPGPMMAAADRLYID